MYMCIYIHIECVPLTAPDQIRLIIRFRYSIYNVYFLRHKKHSASKCLCGSKNGIYE